MIFHNQDIDHAGHPVILEVWCCECRAETECEIVETPHSRVLMCKRCTEYLNREAL
jgi:hypothetical protein